MKKGFTLVELLAVIVILAVIAIIATPVVLNMISDARINSAKAGATNYAKAFEETLVKEIVKGKEFNSGLYSIIGNTYTIGDKHGLVEVKGSLPSSGTICTDKKGQVTSYVLTVNGYTIGFFDKKQEILKGEQANINCEKIVIAKDDKTKPSCTIKAEIIDNDEKVIGDYQEGTYIENKTKITVTGKDNESKISKIEITASKEKDKIIYKDIDEIEKVETYINKKEGLNEISAKIIDYAGNVTTCNTIKVGQDFTTSIESKSKSLTLGSSDYNFKDNINSTFLDGEGTVECTPENSKKTGTYDVTCTAKAKNGREVSTTFTVKHSYAATKTSYNATNNTHTHTSDCYESTKIGHSGSIARYEYSKVEGGETFYCKVTFSDGCTDYNQCHTNGYHYISETKLKCNKSTAPSYSCPNGGSLSGTSCVKYTCPNGGTLSGTTCNY